MDKKKNIFSINFFLLSIISLVVVSNFSCNQGRYLKKNEYLLHKNEVQVNGFEKENSDRGFEKYDFEDLIKPIPNSRLLWMPVYLSIYNSIDPEKAKLKKEKKDLKCSNKLDNKIEQLNVEIRIAQKNRELYEKGTKDYQKYNKKLNKSQNKKNILSQEKCDWKSVRQKIGEEPVVYKSINSIRSSKQMQIFLRNRGYYNSKVEVEISKKNEKSKQVNLLFKISPGKVHLIQNTQYNITDSSLRKIVLSDTINRLIKKNKRLDSDLLQAERERIELFLRNKGYFKFSKEYIHFTIDTLSGNYLADIVLNIKTPSVEANKKGRHKKYRLNNITIYPDYDPKSALEQKLDYLSTFDTTYYTSGKKYLYKFLHHGKINLRPKSIVRGVYLYKDSIFNLDDVKDTYRYLSSLKIIKIANINFIDAENDSLTQKVNSDETSEIGYLNCELKLSEDQLQSYTFEITGTNSSGNIGAAGNIFYQNKNIFHNGEVLDINLKVALESQTNAEKTIWKLFNSSELGGEMSLKFPRMLTPVKLLDFNKRFTPSTEMSALYNQLKRPDYNRTILGVSYNYSWNSTEAIRHIFEPITLDLIELKNPTKEFLDYIEKYNLEESYKNHLIASVGYNIIINNQLKKHKRNYTYIKFGFKSAGALISSYMELSKAPKTDGNYQLFKNIYSQFVKSEIDFRYYRKLSRDNDKIVVRTYVGAAYPYGNTHDMPFGEKYFSGGANSIRAWQVRTLGPGSIPDTTGGYPNQTADIKLEGNFEYRVKLFWMIEGAFFVDAGNIWDMNKNTNREGGQFKIDNFYNEIAIGSGLGFRFDFDFFIVRFDFGIKLRDPAAPLGKRWILGTRKFVSNDWAFNVGIGYPF